MSGSNNVGVPGRIERDTRRSILAATTQKDRIGKPCTGSIELRDKSIAAATAGRLSHRTCRKVQRWSGSRHVSVPGRIHGNAITNVAARSAKVR